MRSGRARRWPPGSCGRDLAGVRLGVDGVPPPAGRGPDQRAGFGLAELPAAGLLGLVMTAAQRVQVALTGPPALAERDRVIVIAAHGRAAAAGEPATRAADLDDVPQRVRGLVAGRLAPVLAGPGLDRRDRHGREPPGAVPGARRAGP